MPPHENTAGPPSAPPRAPPAETKRAFLVALALGGWLLITTAATTLVVKNAVGESSLREFSVRCQEIHLEMADHLQKGADRLNRSAAFLSSPESRVTRADWQRFMAAQPALGKIPGLQSVGFARHLNSFDLNRHLEELRAEGFPNYTLRPEGESTSYAPITYAESLNPGTSTQLGFDLLSIPAWRRALLRARDERRTTLAEKTTFPHTPDPKAAVEFTIFAPVFGPSLNDPLRLNPPSRLLGWIYHRYPFDPWLRGVLGDSDLTNTPDIRLEIFDGDDLSASSQLHDTSPLPAPAIGARAAVTNQKILNAAGHQWTLRFTQLSPTGFFGRGDRRIWLTLIIGTTSSLFLAALLFSLLKIHPRLPPPAQTSTLAMEPGEDIFRAILDSSVDWEIWCGPDRKIRWVNAAAERITGYTPAEIIAMPDLAAVMIAPDDRARFRNCLESEPAESGRVSPSFICIHKNDTKFLVGFSWRPLLGSSGHSNGWRLTGRDLSAQQQLETELRRSTAALEQSNLAIMITDQGGKIEFVNHEFTVMTGYTSAEVIGRNPRLLKSGQTPATTYQSLWQQLNRGESWRGEFINQKKNGEIFWEDVNIAPLRNDQGTLTHYVAIKHDISEQRRLQIELKESNDRLNLATRAGGVGIWDYNAPNATMVWDDQMLRLHGLTPEQFSNHGTSWIQSIHPEDRLRYTTTFERALKGGDSFELEFRVIWPNGSIHEIKALAVVFRDARNRPHRVCGTHWDITLEKSTVAALLSSESLLQSVLESTPLGLLVVSHPTSEIINFNNRFCQIWSLEALSAPMRRGETGYRDLLAHCSQRLADAPAFMAGHTAWSDPLPLETVECEIACVQNQTIRYFSTPIPDVDPQKHRRLHVYEDITLKKRHAAEIATSLEKANLVAETRARFISTISHEFRTPMTAAMAAAELLQYHFDRIAPTKRNELLARIGASLHRLTEILDDVLVLNRADAQRTVVRLSPVNLPTYLENIIEEIRISDRDNHPFSLHAEGDLTAVTSDPHLLHHIVSNLLSNAVRYSPAGRPVIIRIAAEATQTVIDIEDHGIGIPSDDLARIFQPFERGTNVGNTPGTGLGLNIAERMAGLLAGTLTARSTLGTGTCFTLLLPHQH